mmetsp:Transcript_73803/g.117673  ORF Transcript_73803/g.117673 Transcript_73803/m.117673 type:complete len:97 (+) Transcript_73803:97-387(+)
MNRLTYFIVLFVLFLFVWLAPLYSPGTLQMITDIPNLHLFWRFLPIELLFMWGVYAGLSVLNNVRNVKDYPESKNELLRDIKHAKEQLTKAGFDWN